MKKASLVCAIVLGFGVAGPVAADDKTIGAVIGGTAGGAVGYQLGGEGGAAIGAVLGAVIGAEIADDDRGHKHDRHHYRYDDRRHHDHRHYDRRHYDNRHVYRGQPSYASVWGHRPPARVVYVDHDRRWRGDDRRRHHDHYHRHGRDCDD